jgi:SAM-dependent methyltransferase
VTSEVDRHYGRSSLDELVLDALRRAGKDDGQPLTPDELAPLDQFHTGGKTATLELARRAGLTQDMHVLDVGGGLGGPARLLATELGCRVTVLDQTAAYCRVGELLTARTGLSDRVSFQHGDALAMPFDDASFDLVWTQHSSMNIADKKSLYREIRRVLRLAGRLALHEIMAGRNTPLHFPVPWAHGPGLNFLLQPQATRSLLEGLGFRELEWADMTDLAVGWFASRVAVPMTDAPPLGLHVLLGDDFEQMFRNQVRNLVESRISVIQAVLTQARAA